MGDLHDAAETIRYLESINMSEYTEVTGPEFLEQYADRLEANGLNIEAGLMRKRAREWSLERQGIVSSEPAPSIKPTAGKAFNAVLVGADFNSKSITLEPEGDNWRVRAGRYHLIPVQAAA